MSQDILKLYWGSPTAGEVDGTEISQATELWPVESGFPRRYLRPWIQEVCPPILCAARCQPGMFTEQALITPEGASAFCWRLAEYRTAQSPLWLAWAQGLTILTVGRGNRLFWLQARGRIADMDENLRTDIRVDLRVIAKCYEVR